MRIYFYAYQKYEDIQFFHEMMSIARSMAYDTPDNAPVQAVYSFYPGIEYLNISGVMNLKRRTTNFAEAFRGYCYG